MTSPPSVSFSKSHTSPSEFSTQVHQAIQWFYAGPDKPNPLAGLCLTREDQKSTGENLRQATNKVIMRALDNLGINYPDEAAILRTRYIDETPVYAVARQLNIAEVTFYLKQRRAIDLLVQTIWDMEQQAQEQRKAKLVGRLEAGSYTQLFGVKTHLTTLLHLLLSPAPPWIVSVNGIGGIGKTSLADATLRAAIDQQPEIDVAWVSARHGNFPLTDQIHGVPQPALTVDALLDTLATQLLPGVPRFTAEEQAIAALRAHCARQPTVLVVDNLETAAEVDSLLSALRRLASPAKVLLTTRHSPFDKPGIFHFQMTELSEADALALLRSEAENHNIQAVGQTSDAELHPLYETVGGNPLALKCVVGLIHYYSLPQILTDLAALRGQTIENLYTYIYRAAWNRLSEMARRTLLALCLLGEHGGRMEQIAEISELEADDLRNALAELITRNLAVTRGDLHARRYNVHHLTRTFFLEQVARWQLEKGGNLATKDNDATD